MAITVAQEAVSGASLSAASSTTITASITVSAGSIIWAFAVGSGAAASATFSDGTNTWASLNAINFSSTGSFDGRALNVAAGTYTVTCTFASAMTDRGLILVEVTGAANVTQQDAKAARATYGTSTDEITSGTLTPTSQPALVLAATRTNGGFSTVNAGTGYTGLTQRWTASGDVARAEWRRITSTSTLPATFTTPNAGANWWTHAVVFTEDVPAGVIARRRAPAPWADDDAPAPRRKTRAIGVGESAGLPPVAGLQLWLRGDLGVFISGGAVQGWRDQSGHTANDTASTLVALPVSSINGKQGFRLTGSEYFTGGSNILAGNSPRTIFVVHQPSGTTYGSLLTLRTSTLKADYFPSFSSANGLIYTDGVNPGNNASVATHNIQSRPTISQWTSAGPGAVLGYKENGVAFAVTQPSGSSTDSGAVGFNVGGGGAAIANYAGDLCEVLVFDSVLSAGDEAAIQSYLATRYGIATAPVVTPRARSAASWWWSPPDEPPPRHRVLLVPASAPPAADQVPCRPDAATLLAAWEPGEPWPTARRPRFISQTVATADTVLYRRRWPAAVLAQWEAGWETLRRRFLVPPPIIPNNQVIRPPLVAVVGDLEQTVSDYQLGNAAAVDSIELAVTGDT